MAQFIFNEIDDLKKYVGGGANVSLELDSLSAAMYSALHNHILPWLGAEQWEALLEEYTTVSGVIADMGSTFQALLPYVQRPLALLSIYEYLHVGGVQLGEAGIHRVETDSRKSAYKYQENQTKNWHLHNGYEALEQLQFFLTANAVDYPTWQDDTAIYNRSRELFINTATDFRGAYSKYLSRYTFELLRELVDDVEQMAIMPLLGEAQATDLKTNMLDDNLTAKESELLKRIRKALVNFTMEEALKRLWVKLDGKNVVEADGLEPQTYEKYGSPSGQAFNVNNRHLTEHANIHIQRIKDYVTTNVADFPLYQAYLDELAAAAAEAAELDTCTDDTNPRYREPCNTYYDDFNLSLPSRNTVGKGFITF